MSKDLDFSPGDSSLRHKVFQYMKSQLLKGIYAKGEILLETKLADELGVSRTPVREAIWLLEVEGLVEISPKKGAVVLGITAKDVADIAAMRVLLERLAARWATARLTDAQLKEMQKICDLCEFYVQKRDAEELAKLDDRFHQLIYAASGSKMLNRTLTHLHEAIQQARQQSINTEGRFTQFAQEHLVLLQAFRSRNAEEAEQAIIHHIRMANQNILSQACPPSLCE